MIDTLSATAVKSLQMTSFSPLVNPAYGSWVKELQTPSGIKP